MQRSLFVAIKLHEHQVPNLNVTIAVRVGAARWPAGNVFAVIVEDFRTRSARAGVTHLPEIVALVGLAAGLVAQAHDPLLRHADVVRPMVVGFVVGVINRDPKLVFGQSVFDGDQFPRETDRVLLEIIAEAEIAEHLEKRVVPRGVADVFKVVVLATGAHAALRGRRAVIGAFVLAKEHVFELHHARVSEEQGRVVARHQRAGGDNLVAVTGEIIEKTLADFGTVHEMVG